jgi:hypothetical protein
MARWSILRAALFPLSIASAVASQEGALIRTEGWRHLFEPGPVDPGIGMVSFAEAERETRVIPGFAADGTPIRAWAPLDTGSVELTVWAEHLRQNDLFFRAGVAPAFFDAPNGPARAFPLPAEIQDYVLHPLDARGA